MTRREKAAWHRDAAASARQGAEKCRKAGQLGNANLFEILARAHQRIADRKVQS